MVGGICCVDGWMIGWIYSQNNAVLACEFLIFFMFERKTSSISSLTLMWLPFFISFSRAAVILSLYCDIFRIDVVNSGVGKLKGAFFFMFCTPSLFTSIAVLLTSICYAITFVTFIISWRIWNFGRLQLEREIYFNPLIEGGSSGSHSVENSLGKILCTCRKTDYRMMKSQRLLADLIIFPNSTYRLYFCVFYGSQNTQQLFPYIT